MSILDYIERIKRENEGPRITAQEPRIGLSDGLSADYPLGDLHKRMQEAKRAWRTYKGSRHRSSRKLSYPQFFKLWAAENMAEGGRIGLQGGQLVQPGPGRQGYRGLPKFVHKENGTYRVRVKKSELNPHYSESGLTLKDAKKTASTFKQEGKRGTKTDVSLTKNAQSVVNDYNKIVAKAAKNKNLSGVSFFETYVNENYNKKDARQILSQTYKNKLNYTELSQVRRTVAKELVKDFSKMETVFTHQDYYNRLGIARSSSARSDLQKIITNGLKDEVKRKVGLTFENIRKNDQIIDGTLKKTIAQRIGMTPGSGDTWTKYLDDIPYYKKNKRLINYSFRSVADIPGSTFNEILSEGKYRIGGGVTWSGDQTQFTGVRKNILEYAKTHWHRHNYDGNPEKSLIQFFDKKGNPIKWKPGLKLKVGQVQFMIPSESNSMFSFSGAKSIPGSVSVTGPEARATGIFDEVVSTFKSVNDIASSPVTHPKTGIKTTYGELITEIYKGYGWSGKNIVGLDLDHFKGVKDHPFKNLRAMDKRLNISLGSIDKHFPNRNLKTRLKKELLGELYKTTGRYDTPAYEKTLKKNFLQQADNVLVKGIKEPFTPYYQAIKNVMEQKDLPKTQARLLEKYIEKLGCFGRVKQQGGGDIDCFEEGKKKIKTGQITAPGEKALFTKLAQNLGPDGWRFMGIDYDAAIKTKGPVASILRKVAETSSQISPTVGKVKLDPIKALRKAGKWAFGPVEVGTLPLFLAGEALYSQYANKRDLRKALERIPNSKLPQYRKNLILEGYSQEAVDRGDVGLEDWAIDQPNISGALEKIGYGDKNELMRDAAGAIAGIREQEQAARTAELERQRKIFDPYAPMAGGGRHR